MKTTAYFRYTRERPDRAGIKDEWIRSVIDQPRKKEYQLDGRIRKWGWIEEEKKYLRVILLADEETDNNAFFDRSFQPEK